jgi:hypothetical protein
VEQNVAVEKILSERRRQDQLWPRDERRKAMYATNPPHILLLEERAAELRKAWYAGNREACLTGFVEMGAIALRALEEAG